MTDSNTSPESLAESIKKLAADIGYVECGFTDSAPFTEYGDAIADLAARFPDAAHHYERMKHRIDPRRKTPWVRSLIVCVRWYGKYRLPTQPVGHIGRSYLGDRRTKGCPDNNMPALMKKGLIDMGIRVKVGGVPDRLAAARAGIAQFGRNCFAYTAEHGSWINIETWRVDAELPPDPPSLDLPCPPDCRRCIDACPTKALSAPMTVRLDHCIAHLTYKEPHPIDLELSTRMGEWVYGCDICQEVCPLNRDKWLEMEDTPWLDRVAAQLTPERLAQMDEETYLRDIHPLFWYIGRKDVARWHANALRAMAAGTRDATK